VKYSAYDLHRMRSAITHRLMCYGPQSVRSMPLIVECQLTTYMMNQTTPEELDEFCAIDTSAMVSK
jgi:hypothetical protein